jgi:hypothetical protein
MEYIFRIDQLDILNTLIDDASISLKSIENLKLVDNYIEFEIERRTFENVTRKKKLFWNFTYLNGKTSIIHIENVSELSISGLREEFNSNHLINSMEINPNGELIVETVFGLFIKMKTNSEFIIKLKDIKDSEFGKGKVNGVIGYTKEEWRNNLIIRSYINPKEETL